MITTATVQPVTRYKRRIPVTTLQWTADYPDDLPHTDDARIVLTRFNGPGVRINCTADCRDGHHYIGGCALRRLDSDDLIAHAAASEPVGVDEPRTGAVLTPMQPAAQQWPNGGTTGNDSPFAA